MNLKNLTRKFADSLGYLIVHKSTIGINLENDLGRLTADDPILTVFDVGGNFGQSAVRFAHAFPDADVYTFEPVPHLFSALCVNTSKFRKIKGFNLGFGDKRETAMIGLALNPGANSLHIAKDSANTCKIELDTLDAFVQENNVARIDLLKIDVEGHEIPVIHGALASLEGKHIRYIYVECVFSPDPDEPHTSFHEIHEILDSLGFSFITCYTESFKLGSGCSMVNALFGARGQLPEKTSGKFHNMV
jgi:FkbM family methyltransferase